MDQIQEKKTTKSTSNMSKNPSFIPSMSHLQKPYDNPLNEISGSCEKILPVYLALVFFIPQISDQKTDHNTMLSLKKVTKELRQEIVSYLFPFPLLVKV